MKTKVDVKCSFKVESYFQGLESILNIQLANNKKKVWRQLPIVNSDYLSQAKSKEEA